MLDEQTKALQELQWLVRFFNRHGLEDKASEIAKSFAESRLLKVDKAVSEDSAKPEAA